MDGRESPIYKIISIAMIIGIVILVVDVIIPKYANPAPEKILEEIDFSSSDWIEQYVENRVGIFGKDFYVSTAFTYNIRANKMVLTYASQNSVEEAREYYLTLPGAELTGRNDQTSLNIIAEDEGQELRVYNYFSQVSRVFELELTLTQEQADLVISQLEEEFPEEEILKIPEIQDLIAGKVFGGYVRYRYDRLDQYSSPYVPIFSRAYFYPGSEEDFLKVVEEIKASYPDYRYNQSQNTHHFRNGGQNLFLSFFITDAGESVVSISLQEIIQEN